MCTVGPGYIKRSAIFKSDSLCPARTPAADHDASPASDDVPMEFYETKVSSDSGMWEAATTQQKLNFHQSHFLSLQLKFDFPFFGYATRDLAVAWAGYIVVPSHTARWATFKIWRQFLQLDWDLSNCGCISIHW